MSVEKISLRWQNHESSLRGFLRDLRSASWLGDVLLCAGDTEVAAHGLVLAAGSLQLRRMLARGHARSPPCPQQLIHLRGVAGPVLESILTFLYEGEVSVARDQLPAFLAAAARGPAGFGAVHDAFRLVVGRHGQQVVLRASSYKSTILLFHQP